MRQRVFFEYFWALLGIKNAQKHSKTLRPLNTLNSEVRGLKVCFPWRFQNFGSCEMISGFASNRQGKQTFRPLTSLFSVFSSLREPLFRGLAIQAQNHSKSTLWGPPFQAQASGHSCEWRPESQAKAPETPRGRGASNTPVFGNNRRDTSGPT